MMDDITQDQISTQLATLPREVRELLTDPKTYDQIATIGGKYKFTTVEIGLLSQVTSTLMIGLLKPTDFVASLMDYLSIPRETAVLLAQDINRDIFNPVKELLKQVHHIAKSTATLSPIQPTSSVLAGINGGVVTPTASPTKPEEVVGKSIFEQKLGNTFRMSPTIGVPEPKLVTPEAPHAALPPTPATGPKKDPYREAID